MDHVVLKHRRTTLERCQKYISDELEFFNDENLCKKIYPEKHPFKSLTHYAAKGRISYTEAVRGEYKPAKIGDTFGPVWSSHWFCVVLEIPVTWVGREVHLFWDSQSEAMVWRDGQPLCGLCSEDRVNMLLSDRLTATETSQKLYIEMACNTLFGAGDSLIGPPKADKQFTLTRAELAVRDPQAFRLYLHLQVLNDMAEALGEASERGNEAMLTANRMVNQVLADGGSSFTRAIEIGTNFLKQRNGDSQHVVHAIGNCHIDSAWLWPYAETIRKCARSWSTTLRLMEKYTDLTFACSQAQQFEWVKEHYPGLYEQMKDQISLGRFIPVGAAWVEMDGNMPGGEAFVRQFLYGQRFFKQEFGVRCKEFWLPDTFGYSAQIPQIMRLFGLERFLTQKLSWNLVNKFPHNTFWWEGIDGSRVLTHFPPGDNYGMQAWPKEVLKTRNNHSDKGRSPRSMYLYGYGDGGQGPTEAMLERLRRMEDVDGLPKVRLSSPDDYFLTVEREDAGKLCTWSGELYLEMHNGTYTTQAQTKFYNRRCEGWLRDCEVVCSVASVLTPFHYPSEELLRMWKLLLLNQFHDVLPGSSIAEVYEDAIRYYKEIESSVAELTAEGVGALAGVWEAQIAVFNTLGWERREVISLMELSQGTSVPGKRMRMEEKDRQMCRDGSTLVLLEVGSCGISPVRRVTPRAPVSALTRSDGSILVKNSCLEAVINLTGHITELYVGGDRRNAVMDGEAGNVFVLFDDRPLYWDAWDVMHYHLETRKALDEVIAEAAVEESGPLRATIKVSWRISEKSSISQQIILEADCPYLRFDTQVEWHESHKFLKVEFPTSVKADNATYEIQFGNLQRPTHTNTSWDMAQFEVCSHRWADLSEYGFGVAVLNDSKYGFSTARNVMRLSLLRSPKAPDPNADMGTQKFTYALMPHAGSFQSAGVVEQAHRLNSPLIQARDCGAVKAMSYFSLDSPQVVLDTVKRAEDDERALVLRLYESFGGSVTVRLSTTLPLKSLTRCDGYEEAVDDHPLEIGEDGGVSLPFSPFQIVSLQMKF